MSGYKDMLKKGWHPDKGSSLVDSVKGRAKNLVGRGEDSSRTEHVAPPLSSLRDPAGFAPPPKRNPNATTTLPSPSPSQQQQQQQQQQQLEPSPAADEPPAPPKPWRLDTTGLSTAHLPPPPGRKDGADGGAPPRSNPSSPAALPSPPPGVPKHEASPSLPTRPAPSQTPSHVPSPGPAQGYVNQAATSRLAAAGVSVPALGIGAVRSPGQQAGGVAQVQMNELQARFARMNNPTPTGGNNPGGSDTAAAVAAKKKPPPPPPKKKKPGLAGGGGGGGGPGQSWGQGRGGEDDEGVPPPIPMATRPRF
ncbi:hypothetical protein C8A05DRAFT_33620 [Staphylotrichum tortipilum]|uniref:Uncharacterized protein n=1 Tax=Staphylotrichum tortipilum TaxID=2831512 RepID=A0AAN6MLI2_9PEZI|nr:hypothetical protein C8A05DRAFT_33620 [Staphylotrichum longicolle]